MNNLIAYAVQQNNTMTHSMSLNNRISCVVGIFIFGFKTYWQRVFNLVELKKTNLQTVITRQKLNTDKNDYTINDTM